MKISDLTYRVVAFSEVPNFDTDVYFSFKINSLCKRYSSSGNSLGMQLVLLWHCGDSTWYLQKGLILADEFYYSLLLLALAQRCFLTLIISIWRPNSNYIISIRTNRINPVHSIMSWDELLVEDRSLRNEHKPRSFVWGFLLPCACLKKTILIS